MSKSKRSAKSLPFASQGSEDVDPFVSSIRSTRRRKTAQLTKEVFRAVQAALDADVVDPNLDLVWLEEAEPLPTGGFRLIFSAASDPAYARDHLKTLVPVFKEAIARRTARKRVPPLFIEVLPAGTWEVDEDA